MKINFNSSGLGLCGGNRVIFDLSNALVDRGHEVTISCAGLKQGLNWWSPNPIKAKIIFAHYSLIERAKIVARISRANVDKLLNIIPECDVNVATFCMTAFPTVRSNMGKMFYLVQHYEPWFFSDECKRKKADESYKLPMTRLCVSKWLADKVNGVCIGNGVDLTKFTSLDLKRDLSRVMIFFRGMNWKEGDIYSQIVSEISKKYTLLQIHGNYTDAQLVTAYNLSGVFLYLSKHEGFGLPPLEAMACGLPVITTDCLEYAVHGKNALILPKSYSVQDIMDRIELLKNNSALRCRLIKYGYETALSYDFKHVVDKFEKFVKIESR
jgi:hypothetical protein